VQFLIRQPRSGRIPIEKMDLMNTINQLLLEMNKLKNDKVTLEEEIKLQRRCHMRNEVKRIVTTRDVAMAANNKVIHKTSMNLKFEVYQRYKGIIGVKLVVGPLQILYL
jgi:macrodomain Ter protein organizer (MatP/YcbG family)